MTLASGHWHDSEVPEAESADLLMTTTAIAPPAVDALGQIQAGMLVMVPGVDQNDWLIPDLTGEGEIRRLLVDIRGP